MKLSAVDVVAPIRIVVVFRSSAFFAGAVCHTQVTCGSCSGVPIQPKRPMSNLIALPSGEISLQPRLDRHVAGRHADHRAVAPRDIVEVIGHDQAGRARHVAHDDRRIAGNVPGHVIGDQPRRHVVAAAGRGADQDFDGLAAIEVSDGLGASIAGRQGGEGCDNGDGCAHHLCAHHLASDNDASRRPWPRIGSLMPSVRNAAKKLACV